jgi:S-formylglutathione hydrolase FrmB
VRRALLLCAVAVAACIAFVALAHGKTSRELDEPIRSVALGGRVHARVVLPPGYDTHPNTRYPVLYFLHGLPATSGTYQGNDWLVDALEGAGRAILVMPQGARAGDADPEYLDWGVGRNWSTYIATELPRFVDAHFRTIRTRRGRAILGLSAGGYGATIIGLRHLGTFAVVESWSGYFHPTDPTGTKALDRGRLATAHALVAVLRADERKRATFVAFYVGNGDARFRAENVRLNAELNGAHVPHAFAVYPGAHETALWQRHARDWLRMALAHLAKPKP